MPPRGRPRKGVMRIDAAIDAMLPLGFTIKQVRKCVKELLKVYGGDKGWPFIEDASYNELIAALLRDAEMENQEDVAKDGNLITQENNLLKEKPDGEEKPSLTDNRALDTLQDEKSPGNTVAVLEPVLDGKGRKDILPDQTSALVEETKNKEDPPTKVGSPRTKSAFPPLPPPTKRGKRGPCYGWIEDDDEEDEDDFIILQPSSMVLGPPKAASPALR